MKTLNTLAITAVLEKMIPNALIKVDPEAVQLLKAAEAEGIGRFALDEILENIRIAERDRVPACQDTGLATVFLDIGQDVYLSGAPLAAAVNEGVRRGYRKAYARDSIADPLTRVNTGDNTPAVIYTRIVPGTEVRISFLAKGAGSENANKLFMLPPTAGVAGIVQAVTDISVTNACPPVILGVGIGGDSGLCAELSKRALLLPLSGHNPDPALDAIEKEILAAVNASGAGVMGLGSGQTCLAVRCIKTPCHIGSLPVFVTVQCYSLRRAVARIKQLNTPLNAPQRPNKNNLS